MPFYNPTEKGGKSVAIKDNGITLTTGATSIDFIGAGVSVSAIGSDVTVNIPGGAGFSIANNEVPSGVIDGVNTVFTWANMPLYGVVVALNGSTVSPAGGDYTTVGNVTTFTFPPPPGSIIVGSYEY
jgi:hypothetical protein